VDNRFGLGLSHDALHRGGIKSIGHHRDCACRSHALDLVGRSSHPGDFMTSLDEHRDQSLTDSARGACDEYFHHGPRLLMDAPPFPNR
jgi:hypothetical protein